MRSLLMGLILGGPSLALAGSGPWVIGKRDQNLYLGLEGQRYTVLAPILADENGELGRQPIELEGGVNTIGAKAILTYGVTSRFEVELDIPVYRVDATVSEPICDTFGLQACKTTTTLGLVSTRAKAQLLDEISGAPFSVGLGGILRLGSFTSASRARITNVGEGTIDAGTFLSIGRSGGLGKGYWTSYADVQWLYRMPNIGSFGGTGPAAPGYEWSGVTDTLFAPDPAVAFGPSLTFFARPNGVNFQDLLADGTITDIDRFAALRAYNIRVGAKVIVRNEANTSFVLSVHRTVLSVNNPSDVWTIGAGISLYGLFTRGEG